MKSALPVLAVAYPLLAHLAVALDAPSLLIAALAVLLAGMWLPPLLRGSRTAWLTLPLALAAVATAARMDAELMLLFVPPVLFNAFFAWLFGHTLLRGRTPLIERMVRLLHREQGVHDDAATQARIARYARRLTQLWCLLFVALALLNAALALLAVPGGVLASAGLEPPLAVPLPLWSWFANVWNYAIVAALFVIEYAWRRRVFPQQPYRGFGDFLLRVARVGPRLWRERDVHP